MNKIKVFIASIAPGLFLIGYNIGTGSITTMAVAGAEHGMKLFWPLLLSCIFTYYLIIAFGRYTAITGNTILHTFKDNFGKNITMFVLVSLLLSEWASCMGVMGIVVQVASEWTKPFTASGEGVSEILLAAGFGSMLYYLFWQGKHKFFENVLAIFVTVMALCFIMTMFIVIPDPIDLIKGMIPSLPEGENTFLLIAGTVGTTMGAILFVVRSILVQEKGWKITDVKLEKRDALISVSLMLILSTAVMASAAGTLHPLGLKVENAIDMVKLLEPLAGRFAISLFVAGIVAAGLSSLFPIIILAPWLFADYTNKPRDMKSNTSRGVVLFATLLGLIVPIFGGRPVYVMILSQVTMAVTAPLVIILMLIILNKKSIMGEHALKLGENIKFGVITLFSIIMAVIGAMGLFGL